MAFGPRPRLPWPRVRAECGRPRGVARQPPWGSSSPGRVELVQPAAAGTRRRTEPLLSGSTSVRTWGLRTWGLGRRKERFPLGREAFPARVPGLQLAAGDVIPVGKALGVNRVAGTGTAVALWVPVCWSLPAVLKNHVHTFLKQITNLFRIFMQHFMIFVAELF